MKNSKCVCAHESVNNSSHALLRLEVPQAVLHAVVQAVNLVRLERL